MTEYEKAEQDVAAAKVSERVAEWKAMEAKAVYYRHASEAMQASAEVMGARIRRDNALASEWADKVLATAERTTESETHTDHDRVEPDKAIAALSPGNDLVLLDDGQRPDDLSNSLPSAPAATDDDWEDSCGDINCDECHGPRPSVSDYSRGAQDAIDSIPRMEGDSAEYYRGYDATIESVGPVGADVPEDERDETWAPPPGYTYIPTQGERCVCVNLMQDGIGNFFCCNQRGETSADAERTSDESQAETAIEQTLITDDIPSIPREEIPIGAAVETYTDSGIETVKLGGQTYVVDDEPERQAETQPEAAYAPVNEDEARMWSNGFEADAKSKAEPEQDKRPFWMFAKKEPA